MSGRVIPDDASRKELGRRVAVIGSFVVGAVFMFSAVFKALAPWAAAEVIIWTGEQFSFLVTRLEAALAVGLLVALEVLLAIGIVLRPRARAPRWTSAGVLLLFTGFLAFLASNDAAPSCGCTGVISIIENARAESYVGMARNVLLLILLASPAAIARIQRPPPADREPCQRIRTEPAPHDHDSRSQRERS